MSSADASSPRGLRAHWLCCLAANCQENCVCNRTGSRSSVNPFQEQQKTRKKKEQADMSRIMPPVPHDWGTMWLPAGDPVAHPCASPNKTVPQWCAVLRVVWFLCYVRHCVTLQAGATGLSAAPKKKGARDRHAVKPPLQKKHALA
ncbi:hypothetical protein HPB50_004140 [Hyalomma asiaticum]|uniref:Uncharacterized protein n=1 Tax=Hyalomma asiaticum TaxID=266040 RepID=A0ACB7SAX8_HYAAI|nr:hypothetical protein HPB50_004140 [Hyalomma asiaticum]